MVKSPIKTVNESKPATEVDMMTRKELAEHVAVLVSEDRNETHGDPLVQFTTAQALKGALSITPNATGIGSPRAWNATQREAIEQICTKLSRLGYGNFTRDTFIDIAGYAVIAAEAT